LSRWRRRIGVATIRSPHAAPFACPETLPSYLTHGARLRRLLLLLLLVAGPARAGGTAAHSVGTSVTFSPSASRRGAVVLDLPVRTPGSDVPAPCYRGDELELRLAPAAARRLVPKGARPLREMPVGLLGVPSVDAVTGSLGLLAFEPEFRGETAPESDGDIDFTAFQLVHLTPGADLAAALAALRSLPDVASADPIAILPVSELPDDSLKSETFWLEKVSSPRTDIRAPEAWTIEQGDTSIVVGIIDTGVLAGHPDLSGRGGERGQMYVNWAEVGGLPGVDDDGNGFVDDYSGWDFVASATAGSPAPGEDAHDQDNDPNDFGGHGTCLAGIIGAIPGNGIGLAGVVPRVRLMPLRIGWQDACCIPPQGGDVDMAYGAAAIRYATRMGVTVVNCSWTSVNTGGLDAAVTAATRAGMVVVNAAGNNTVFTYLGQRPDVIAVAATDSNDVVAGFSDRGPWVDLAAAGVHLVSTMLDRLSISDSLRARTPAYKGFLNGTSFAAPQVAGAVALLQAQRLHQGLKPYSPMGALLRVRETADDISALQDPSITGYGTGRLNVFRALIDPTRSLAIRGRARNLGPGVILHDNLGRSRVFYAMNDRTIVCYDGATGDTVWVRPLPALPVGNLAAADFGPPYGQLLAVGTQAGAVVLLHEDGRIADGWPIVAQNGLPLTAGIVLADLDGDRVPEVIAGGTTINTASIFAWKVTGTPVSGFPFRPGVSGISSIAAADLDGTPGAELAYIDGFGSLHLANATGEVPGFPTGPIGLGARAPVIARLGSAGTPPSIIVAAQGQIAAIAPDGTLRWGSALSGTPSQDPVLADLDGDGVDEIITTVDAPTTPPTAAAIDVRDSTGAEFTGLSGWPAGLDAGATGAVIVGPMGSQTGPCVGFYQGTGFVAFTETAQPVPAFPKPGTAGHFPSIGQLDGDDGSEIAAGASPSDSNVFTYDAGAGTWAPSRMLWPTVRGDYARTASHVLPPPLVLQAIGDLHVLAVAESSAVLAWTAPPGVGPASLAYDVAASPGPFDAATFETAPVRFRRPPFIADDGHETLLVRRLTPGRRWRFAVRAERGPDVSPVSNVVETVTPVGGTIAGRGGVALGARPMPATGDVTLDWQSDLATPGVRTLLRIYDLHGREVRSVDLGTEPGGSYNWDGRDGANGLLPAGLYFLRLVSGSRHADSRVVFVR